MLTMAIAGLCAGACTSEPDVRDQDDDRPLAARVAYEDGASGAIGTDAGQSEADASAAPVAGNSATLDAATVSTTDARLVESVSFLGNGCLGNTAQATVAPDRTNVSVRFSEFSLQAGDSSPPEEGIRNCNVSIRVNVPEKHAVTLTRFSGRGGVELSQGARLIVFRDYRFPGTPGNTERQDEVIGAEVKNFHFNDFFMGDEPRLTSACGVPQTFLVNVRAMLGAVAGQVSQGPSTAKLTELGEIKFELRRCD
jgi:hypothetical protein